MRRKTTALSLGVLLVVALIGPVGAQDGDEPSAVADLALAYLAGEHAAGDLADVRITDEYASPHNGVTHVYLRQRHQGVDVQGAVATVNVQDGVAVYGLSRFVDGLAANASGEQVVSRADAVVLAARAVDTAARMLIGEPEVTYLALRDGTVRLAWRVELRLPEHWWHVFVDAEDGTVLRTEDWVDQDDMAAIAASTTRPEEAGAVEAALGGRLVEAGPDYDHEPILPPEQYEDGSSYNVYALPLESPNDGPRRVVENPADAVASPFGWHDTTGTAAPDHTITRGNNVHAYSDTSPTNAPDPDGEPDGGDSLTFDFPIPSLDATPAVYRDAAVTNLFYWNNVMHDVSFRYGFDEAAGNFQEANHTGAGEDGDAVLAEAQDGGGVLNANFATPPDGRPGRMQMYLWVDVFQSLGLTRNDLVRVYSHQVRDGDLDAGVVAHEYGHGISNRLVGGPSNVSCLRNQQERQGEGWSDWWSFALLMQEGDDGATPRGIGTYVIYEDEGRTGKGIRITPYSTDMDVNPSTYNTIRSAAVPHGVGYVWATMLWDLYWNLVEEHGFNANPYESWESGGNNLAMQLVVDSMKFSGCDPGFVDARDAIIAADAALTGRAADGVPGEHECLIWETFARRGLGIDADQGDPFSKTDGTEGYAVPAHCGS
jgi:hypothetical protein